MFQVNLNFPVKNLECDDYQNIFQRTSEFNESDEDAAPKEYPFMVRNDKVNRSRKLNDFIKGKN